MIETVSFNNDIQKLDLSYIDSTFTICWHNLRYFYNLKILEFNYSFDIGTIIQRFDYGRPKTQGRNSYENINNYDYRTKI